MDECINAGLTLAECTNIAASARADDAGGWLVLLLVGLVTFWVLTETKTPRQW